MLSDVATRDVVCMWRLVRLSDHVSLLRTVTFLDAPDGEALELDVSRQIWDRCPGASRGCFLKTLNPRDADIFHVG